MPRNKEFGTAPFIICHWDTFDNDTFKVGEAETLEDARKKVKELYGDRIRETGADRVDIVDTDGEVVKSFRVG